MMMFLGNELTEGGNTFLSTFKDPAGDISVAITDNNNGTYGAKYTAKTAGTHTLIVLLKTDDEGDVNIKDSPFKVLVIPGPLNLSSCDVSGEGLTQVVAGETGEFKAVAKDGFGNIVSGPQLSATVEGPEAVRLEL